MLKNLLCSILSIGVLVLSTNASAALQDSWTFCLGGGWAHAFDHKIGTQYKFGNDTYTTSIQNDGYGIKTYAERNFKDWFGVGLGYNYIKDQKIVFTCEDCRFRMEDHYNIVELYSRFAKPIDDKGSDVFFKIGPTYNWHSFNHETHSVWGGVAGVGVQYAFTPKFSIRGGYDYFYRAADRTFHPDDDRNTRIDQGLLYLSFQYTIQDEQKNAPVAKKAANKVEKMIHSLDAGILFPFDSSVLSDEGKDAVSTIIKSSEQFEEPEFEVYGYTDRLGSDAYNEKLSKNRAESVSAEFANQGISTKVAQGKGKANPVTGDKCANIKSRKPLIDCLAADRRVEVVVTGKKSK
ncbi:MAG: OmpA family protein [Succinivibrio sp.]|nr:OmpA family protein [Succinivibrio sp.]